MDAGKDAHEIANSSSWNSDDRRALHANRDACTLASQICTSADTAEMHPRWHEGYGRREGGVAGKSHVLALTHEKKSTIVNFIANSNKQ